MPAQQVRGEVAQVVRDGLGDGRAVPGLDPGEFDAMSTAAAAQAARQSPASRCAVACSIIQAGTA
ncbi:hypothetical protein ACFWP3_17495 [Streptomyces sp. NPDC058525]|uniref:hypothetical protein n=1 Tax=Streptomyces sp. NPDC058525 TaxID=3346538 RepID=UPI00365EC065